MIKREIYLKVIKRAFVWGTIVYLVFVAQEFNKHPDEVTLTKLIVTYAAALVFGLFVGAITAILNEITGRL